MEDFRDIWEIKPPGFSDHIYQYMGIKSRVTPEKGTIEYGRKKMPLKSAVLSSFSGDSEITVERGKPP